MPRPRKNFPRYDMEKMMADIEAKYGSKNEDEDTAAVTEEPEVTVGFSSAVPTVTVGDYEVGMVTTLPLIIAEPPPPPVNLDEVETIYPLPPNVQKWLDAKAARRAAGK